MSKVFVNAFGFARKGVESIGGSGGWIQASLPVTAGQIFYVFVGGADFNAGRIKDSMLLLAGGSDIRTTLGDLTSRLIVAGGGGGGGSIEGTRGGHGGAVKLFILPFDDL